MTIYISSDAIHKTAHVLFSGGQDSITCRAQALSKYERVETVAFDYGQRHIVEPEARLNVLREIKAKFPHRVGKLGVATLAHAGSCQTHISRCASNGPFAQLKRSKSRPLFLPYARRSINGQIESI